MGTTSKIDNTEKVDNPIYGYVPSEDYWDQYGYNPPTWWDGSKRLVPDIYSIYSWDTNFGRLDDVVDVAKSPYNVLNKAADGVDYLKNKFDRWVNDNDTMIPFNRSINYGKRRIRHYAQSLTSDIFPIRFNFRASSSLRALNYGTKALNGIKFGGRFMPLVSLGFGVSNACDRFDKGQTAEGVAELISGGCSFVPVAGPLISTAIDIDLLLYDTHKFHFGNYVKLPNMLLSQNEATQLWDLITTGENATTRYERECKEKGIEPTKEGAMMFAIKEEIKENIKKEAAYQGISLEEAIEIYKAQQEVIKQYGGTWNYVWETSIKPGLIEAGDASYAISQALTMRNTGALVDYCNKKIEDEETRKNAIKKEVFKHYNTIEESLISQGVPPEEAKKFVKLLIEHEKLVLAGVPPEKAEQLILDQMDKISQKNKYSNNTNSNKINLNTYLISGVSLGAMNAANGSSLGFNAAVNNSRVASNRYENLAGELKEQTGEATGYYAVARSQDMRIDKRMEMRENETYQFHQESILLNGQKDSLIDNRIDRKTINNNQEILARRQVETVR